MYQCVIEKKNVGIEFYIGFEFHKINLLFLHFSF